tara:strand:+ start:412 stop:570 length:159 start_codon:yes stop_codon:yes gene_type:complete
MSITINTSTSSMDVTEPVVITAKATESPIITATATQPTKLNIEVTLNSRSLR